MYYQFASYISFLLRSTNAHGVHSPFIFNLVTKCFYDNTNYSEYAFLKAFRKRLLKNCNFINVEDFGAGSRVFRSSQRRVCDIAKTAGITTRRAQLLYRLCRYFKPAHVLEAGTSLGLATAAMSYGHPYASIRTVEGCRQTSDVAQSAFDAASLTSIALFNDRFDTVFDTLKDIQFDMIYFDGNHQKDATLSYFETLLPTAHNDSVWIFDDIHWSKDMEEAWSAIQQHPKVRVTVDTYQWGLVFFRREQEKEHFTIRV